jgi:UDP-N-acetylglucosamine 4,6-dehydratase
MEAVKTNVIGAMNVVTAAIKSGVKRVVALSTDKAASPINLYGATKLCSDKIFTAARAYAGAREIVFSVVRYGNVFGSRGSVIPFFLKRKSKGVLPITDERMTRFWITLQQGVDFVLTCMNRMKGGEVFVPKIPSMRITDLASAIAPECELSFIGIRPGEKIHEVMIGSDDARTTLEFDDHFVIGWNGHHKSSKGKPCPLGFRYGSDNNEQWLTTEQLRQYVEEFLVDYPEYAQ